MSTGGFGSCGFTAGTKGQSTVGRVRGSGGDIITFYIKNILT